MSASENMMLEHKSARENPIDTAKLVSIEQFAKSFDKRDWVLAGGTHNQEKPCALVDFVIDPVAGIRMRSELSGYEHNCVLSALAGAILIEVLPERIRIFQQDLDRDQAKFPLLIHLARRDIYAPWLAERIIAPIEAKRRAEAERKEAWVHELVEREKKTVMLTRDEAWRKPIDTARLVSIGQFAELYAGDEWVDGDCVRGQDVADAFVDAVIDPAAGIRLVTETSRGSRRARVLSPLEHEIVVEALPERIRVFRKLGTRWSCEFHLARRDVHTPWLAEQYALYEAEMEVNKAHYQVQEGIRAEKRRLDEARWDALLTGVRDSIVGRRLVGIKGTNDEVALTFEDSFVMRINPYEHDYEILCLSVNDVELGWPDESE